MQNAFDGLISRLHVAGKTSLLKDIKTEVSKLKSQDKKGLGWGGGEPNSYPRTAGQPLKV